MSQEELVLSNRYRLERRLATGGMGEVWEATDELLIRPVAVKLLRREYISDEAARSRFRAEARFAAALQHGGIAQVYDYGEQDDLAYLVMELVPGEPLSKILMRSRMLSAEATLDLVSQAARALQVAHGAGIIHRDIKPGNLMVTGDGTVKITDFGIARNGQASELTQVGMVMGTAHYVSPEQASGKDITPATDLYSLGVVAYECLAGRPPFDADSAVAIALKHVRETPPELPPEVPAPVRELVRQLLSKDPASRPDGAQEVADRAYMIRESLQLGTAIAEFEEQLARPEAETGQFHGGAETLAGIAVPGAGGSGGSGGAGAAPGPNARANASAVAVGLLVLGLIVMGSLLRDGQPGNLGDGNGEQPASPPTAVGNDQARQPTGGRTQTAEPSRPAVPVSAGTVESPTPTATPSTPTSKPTGSRSPKPTPSATVTITPEPS